MIFAPRSFGVCIFFFLSFHFIIMIITIIVLFINHLKTPSESNAVVFFIIHVNRICNMQSTKWMMKRRNNGLPCCLMIIFLYCLRHTGLYTIESKYALSLCKEEKTKWKILFWLLKKCFRCAKHLLDERDAIDGSLSWKEKKMFRPHLKNIKFSSVFCFLFSFLFISHFSYDRLDKLWNHFG